MPRTTRSVVVKRGRAAKQTTRHSQQQQNFPFLSGEFNQFFDHLFDGFKLPTLSSQQAWWPQVSQLSENAFWQPRLNFAENAKFYFVSVELPGVEDKDIQLNLSGNTLFISGEKKVEKEDKNKQFHRIEHSFGSFKRSLQLPVDANESKINAKFKNGILFVEIARKATTKHAMKSIKVKAVKR